MERLCLITDLFYRLIVLLDRNLSKDLVDEFLETVKKAKENAKILNEREKEALNKQLHEEKERIEKMKNDLMKDQIERWEKMTKDIDKMLDEIKPKKKKKSLWDKFLGRNE